LDVHSDVAVFEMLMNYSIYHTILINEKNVAGILISSHFLLMEQLESKCLLFLCENLQETINVPIDLSCINNTLIEK
jgi:hypothetical protein